MATKNYTITDELHMEFKIKCIKEKTSMSDEIRKFIERFVGVETIESTDNPESKQTEQSKQSDQPIEDQPIEDQKNLNF